jgi:hypothetical protein
VIRARRGTGRAGARPLLSLVALQVLTCLGASFISALLPDDPNLPPGYYDGDDDDAAATPERLDGAAALVVDTTGGRPLIRPHPLRGLAANSVTAPRSVETWTPLLRSPPA